MDIAPELLEEVQKEFDKRIAEDPDIIRAMRKLDKGQADYITAYDYATALGICLAEACEKVITEDRLPDGRMYYNIANRVVRPLLEQVDAMAKEYADAVQLLLNEKAGIGLKPV